MRDPSSSLVLAAIMVALAAAPVGADATVLGAKFRVKAKPGAPETRAVDLKADESDSPDVLTGDPSANGATVQVILNGATSTSQVFDLPAGESWRRSPRNPLYTLRAWTYRDPKGLNGGVTKLSLTQSSGGRFRLYLQIKGRYASVDLVPPNPGTYAGVVATIHGGDTYCTNFGGVAGGFITRNDEVNFTVVRPTQEGTCASGTPVCGDGVVQTPFEVCDVDNDEACPGLCGVNGLPCQCPLCGDGVVDPGEACDDAALGSCTEGCSNFCQCTVCGDGEVSAPVEDCENAPELDAFCPGLCPGPGEPNQCLCPVCGDNLTNGDEQCDGTDDGACSGHCRSDCTCAICGNDVTEETEQCDGTDDDACPYFCTPSCTCGL